mgnify:CR=1 FL=1
MNEMEKNTGSRIEFYTYTRHNQWTFVINEQQLSFMYLSVQNYIVIITSVPENTQKYSERCLGICSSE